MVIKNWFKKVETDSYRFLRMTKNGETKLFETYSLAFRLNRRKADYFIMVDRTLRTIEIECYTTENQPVENLKEMKKLIHEIGQIITRKRTILNALEEEYKVIVDDEQLTEKIKESEAKI